MSNKIKLTMEIVIEDKDNSTEFPPTAEEVAGLMQDYLRDFTKHNGEQQWMVREVNVMATDGHRHYIES